MMVTPLPIETEVKLLQLIKTLEEIVVTLLGIDIDVSPLQPSKASLLMDSTVLGMVTDTKSRQSRNAPCPILRT